MSRARIVIVGGGFGGLAAAQALKRAPVEVLLVDRRNHHLFQPLLYQVACAAVSAVEIAAPLRHVLRRQRNAAVALGEVSSIDLARREIVFDGRRERYDYLVLAPGAVDNYFQHPEWRSDAPGLKTLREALEVRARILSAFESAELEEDDAARQAWITFVIVGAGPTGVELAGAIKELAVDSIARDFRRVDTSRARVVLVEAGDRVLPALHPTLSKKARRQLEGLGVEVRTGARATAVATGTVQLDDGSAIAARTVLWAAGVKVSPVVQSLGVPLSRGGRVKVGPDLALPDHPEVFVIGDAAEVVDIGRTPAVAGAGATGAAASAPLVPGVAPAAMQMGRHVGRCIAAEVRRPGAARQPFRYWNKGMMATIGRSRAVAEIGPLRFGGLLAWLAWLFIHLLFLVGFRSRLVVLLSWAQSYLFFRSGARVIIGSADEAGMKEEA